MGGRRLALFTPPEKSQGDTQKDAEHTAKLASRHIVEPQRYVHHEAFKLACGVTLDGFELAYECYGELNSRGDNAILICHALSGNHHAAFYHSEDDRKPGWWDAYIGPGLPIDTDRYFVVCANNLGGCHGSTGPTTLDPASGKPWGARFPTVRVRDWVHSQALLADHLGIQCWSAVVGGSLGAMQAMRWALEYPDRVSRCVVIASAMKLTAQNIAFNETARQAIRKDPGFSDGAFLEHGTRPSDGLAIARMIGHITYLSGDGMGQKFGRELQSGSLEQGKEADLEFQIESYLRYQGGSFAQQFDANTYILMTRALDLFDLSREYDHDPVQAFSRAQCAFLVVSFSSDWRFSPQRSQEIVDALLAAKKPVSYLDVQSPFGHDAFLIPGQARYEDGLRAFLAGPRSHVASEAAAK